MKPAASLKRGINAPGPARARRADVRYAARVPGLPLLTLALMGAPPTAELPLHERAPALVIVALPKGAQPELPATELTRAAGAAFRAHTGLDLRAPEQAGVDSARLSRCDRPGRLACWLQAAREVPLSAILVVSGLPVAPGRDRLALTLIDTERALTCQREPSLGAHEATEALEDCIWTAAARAAPGTVEAPELAGFFEDRIRGALAPTLERMGELEPFGAIEINSVTPGAELRIDGTVQSVLTEGRTRLTEVRPGRRRLDVSRPGYAAYRAPVRVLRGQTATVAVELVSLEAPPDDVAQDTLLYLGAAAAATGVALGVFAGVKANSVRSTCLASTPEATCDGLGPPTFALTSGDLPSTDPARVNPSGAPIAAVATGVGLMGAGFTLGALLFEEDGLPWKTLLTGLAAGALGGTVVGIAAR